MKKKLFLGCALGALVAGSPALAAPPAPPPVPVFTWSGWYLGGNAGYSWGNGAPTLTDPALASNGFGLPTSITGPGALNGVIGGPEIGFDWRAGPMVVFGGDADFQWADEKNSGLFNMGYNCEGVCSISGTLGSRISWFGTVRAHAGVLVTPTTLVYATGGFAYGKVSINGSLTNFNNGASCCNGGNPGPSPGAFSFGSSAINTGWAAGGGIRGVFPGAPAWTWKVEYLHVDLGTLTGTGFDPIFGGPIGWSATFTDDIFRVGLDFHP